MNHYKEFIYAFESALSSLSRDRNALYHTAAFSRLHERLMEKAGRRLRQAATKMTELDADVMEDIMKVLKKLSKESTESSHDLEDRFKLTLQLLDYAINKKTPTSPDHIIWLFNKLYAGLGYLFPTTAAQLTTEGVM